MNTWSLQQDQRPHPTSFLSALSFTRASPRSLLFLVACALLGGCASSSVKYAVNYPDPSSPPDGGFAFALRNSTVALSSAPSKPASGQTQATTTGSTPALAPASVSCKDNSSEKSADPPTWEQCWRSVLASVSPISDQNFVFVAVPDNSVFSKTKLTPKVSTSDLLMLTSVTFSSNSTIPSAISSAGTGAAAGFAFGPWGAVAGGVIGAISAVVPIGRSAVPVLEWPEYVCDGETRISYYKQLASSTSATLKLPVALDYTLAPTLATTQEPCWTALPATNGSIGGDGSQSYMSAPAYPPTIPTGWFYRFAPNSDAPRYVTRVPPVVVSDQGGNLVLPAGIIKRTDYIQEKPGQWKTESLETFPVSACHAVELQVTWWTELRDQAANPAAKAARYQIFPLIVADPEYVQVIASPTGGTVNLLTLCGGYATSAGPSTDTTDSLNNLIKAVQAVKAAEPKANSTSKAPAVSTPAPSTGK